MPTTLKSLTTTNAPTDDDRFPPIHPGEILLEEFLKPLGLSQYGVAKALGVPPRRINEIVHGKRAITADTAMRLGRYFAVSPRFWLNLQVRHDLDALEDSIGEEIERSVPVLERPDLAAVALA